jgi:hypothetical protein
MKTIRCSVIISGRAIATVLWYDGSAPCHYSTSDIRMDTLSTGTYYVTVAAHLLQGSTMSILIDDVTNLVNPRHLFAAVCTDAIVNFSLPYDV